MGLLATTGDVPAQIAQARHTDADVARRAHPGSVTDPAQATIRITAVGDVRHRDDRAGRRSGAPRWPTTSTARTPESFTDAARPDGLNTLTGLTNQINALQAQSPTANSIQGQQLQSLINQYRLDDEQFQGLGRRPGPILTVLQQPDAIPVGAAAYTTFLHNGQIQQQQHHALASNTKNPEIGPQRQHGQQVEDPAGPIPRGLHRGVPRAHARARRWPS